MSGNLYNLDWEVYILNHPWLQTEQDAYLHYINGGHLEHRPDEPPPIFNAETYVETYPNLNIKTERDAYIHFMKVGHTLSQQKPTNLYNLMFSHQYKKVVDYNNKSMLKPTVKKQKSKWSYYKPKMVRQPPAPGLKDVLLFIKNKYHPLQYVREETRKEKLQRLAQGSLQMTPSSNTTTRTIKNNNIKHLTEKSLMLMSSLVETTAS